MFLDNLQPTTIRNGVQTTEQNYQRPNNNPSASNDDSRRNNAQQLNRGLHETFDWYDACYTRRRNEGLWLIAMLKYDYKYLNLKDCSLLTKFFVKTTEGSLQLFIHGRTLMAIVAALNAPRRETTIHIGIPPRGGTLLFWLTMLLNVNTIDARVTIVSQEECVKKLMQVVI